MKPLTDLISEVQNVEEKAEKNAFKPTVALDNVTNTYRWQRENDYLAGAASQSPIADALREAIKALELIKNSPEWKSTTTSGDEIYHTYSATSISVASEFSGKIRAILEGKDNTK